MRHGEGGSRLAGGATVVGHLLTRTERRFRCPTSTSAISQACGQFVKRVQPSDCQHKPFNQRRRHRLIIVGQLRASRHRPLPARGGHVFGAPRALEDSCTRTGSMSEMDVDAPGEEVSEETGEVVSAGTDEWGRRRSRRIATGNRRRAARQASREVRTERAPRPV